MLSDKQKQLFMWFYQPYDTLIAEGSIRSGKSYAMSVAYIFWAMSTFNNCNFIMAGQSVGSLERNVVNKLITLLKNSQEIKFGVKANVSKHYVDVYYRGYHNRFYCFGGADSDSYISVQGLTSAGAYFDECTLLNEEFVNQCIARCSVEGAKFWFNCNPKHPSHWFKTEWINQSEGRNAKVLKFTLDDNPSLSEATKQMYKNSFKGVFYRRYINGEWCLADGLIYDNWKVDEFDFSYMLNAKDYYRRDKYIKLTGLDFGYSNHPTAVIASLFDKNSNTIYIYKEIYKTGLLSKPTYEAIKNADLHKYKIIADSASPQMIDELRCFGLNVIGAKKAKGSVEAGIQKLQSLHIIVHQNCINTISEFNSYSWATDKNTGKPTNTTLKENDHLMDALRYSLQGIDNNFSFN